MIPDLTANEGTACAPAMASAEALLQALVSIRSVSGQEAEIADFIANLATSWGYAVHRDRNNVWFEAGRGGPRLLLAGHVDTVPRCEGWSQDPWKPEWHGNVLSGLGANDAKGCVAAMLWAAKHLAQADLQGTAVFAFACEEETGGPNGMGHLIGTLGSLDAALVGEPTSLQPCIAQRGMLILTCTARGESGHSAHAPIGDNAIHKAARDILQLSAMAFEPHDLLGVTRPQVNLIQGGTRANLVPDACEFTVDLRTTPNLDHRELAARINQMIESDVAIRSERYLPKATPSSSPIARAALAASGRTNFVGSTTTSDWAFLGGIPAVKIGPGDTKRSHRPDEFLTSEELQAGAAFYQQAIQTYFALVAKETIHVG